MQASGGGFYNLQKCKINLQIGIDSSQDRVYDDIITGEEVALAMLTELGKYLRKLRIDNGQLLKDMADILGISSANLSAVENGKRKPQYKMIQDIIHHYWLNDEEQDELWDAYAITREEVSLSLENATDKRRDVGLAFARQFDELSSKQMDDILKILHKKP